MNLTEHGANNIGAFISSFALGFAVVGYSLIAVIEFIAWTQIGEPNALRNGVEVNVAMLFATILLPLSFFGSYLRDGRKEWRVSLEMVLFFALVAIGILVTQISAIDPKASNLALSNHVITVIAAYFLCLLLRNGPTWGRRWLLWSIPLQCLLYIPFLVWLYQNALFDAGVWWWSGPPGWGLFRYWSVLLAAGIVVLAAMQAQQQKTLPTVILVLAMVMLWCCLLWTGSRANVLGLAVVAAVGGIFVPRFWKRSVPILFLTAAVATPIAHNLELPAKGYGVFFLPSQDGDEVGISSGRFELWSGALDLISKRPLLGHGLDQFSYYTDEKHYETHNGLIQVFFDTGIIGGTVFITFISILIFRSFRIHSNHGDAISAAAILVLIHLSAVSMFEFILHAKETVILISLCFAIVFSIPRTSRSGLSGDAERDRSAAANG